MGDRTWLEDVDLTLCVGVAIHAYCDPSVMAQVPSEEEYMKCVSESAAKALDCSRYYVWGPYVMKKVISGKVTQRKVGEALDEAREEVLKQGHPTMEGFIGNWIQLTIKKLSKDGNPK